MLPRPTPLVPAIVALLLGSTLPAQATPTTATPKTATPSARATAPATLRTRDDSLHAISAMRASLRMLVTAEEGYWAKHGTYTTEMITLGFGSRRGPDDAPPQVLFAGSRSWTAMATHPALRGLTCVMYVGDASEMPVKLPVTRHDQRVAEEEGAPTCDVLPTTSVSATPGVTVGAGYGWEVSSNVVQDDSASQALVARIRADISALRSAQDAYRATHDTYAGTLEALAFRPTSGASFTLQSNAGEWSVEVTHPSLPGSGMRARARRK